MFSRIILLARRGALQFLAESECKGRANFYNTKLFEKKISNFFHTFLQACYSQQVIEKTFFTLLSLACRPTLLPSQKRIFKWLRNGKVKQKF